VGTTQTKTNKKHVKPETMKTTEDGINVRDVDVVVAPKRVVRA
jgi:hypothetical protein